MSIELWWCNVHQRLATHFIRGKPVCDPALGGIMLPCAVGLKVKNMSLEDFALRFEGLDPVRVNAIVDNLAHLAGVVDTQVESVKELLIKANALSAVVQAELPRIKKTIADIQSQLAAYEANQRRFNR